MVLLLYNLFLLLLLLLYICFYYSLHCPLSGPDLTYISLLIIPCIIYHVTNKETLRQELIPSIPTETRVRTIDNTRVELKERETERHTHTHTERETETHTLSRSHFLSLTAAHMFSRSHLHVFACRVELRQFWVKSVFG